MMDHVVARVRIRNPGDPSKFMELELLVDTGSIYTWIKRNRLEKLSVRSMARWKFKTIGG